MRPRCSRRTATHTAADIDVDLMLELVVKTHVVHPLEHLVIRPIRDISPAPPANHRHASITHARNLAELQVRDSAAFVDEADFAVLDGVVDESETHTGMPPAEQPSTSTQQDGHNSDGEPVNSVCLEE